MLQTWFRAEVSDQCLKIAFYVTEFQPVMATNNEGEQVLLELRNTCLLGSGAFGLVTKAELRDGSIVAVKTVKASRKKEVSNFVWLLYPTMVYGHVCFMFSIIRFMWAFSRKTHMTLAPFSWNWQPLVGTGSFAAVFMSIYCHFLFANPPRCPVWCVHHMVHIHALVLTSK